jgi:class 3 adenylate cyclase
VEVEILVGQSICVGHQHEFLLSGEPVKAATLHQTGTAIPTMQEVTSINVTVLVGDIRDYTVLVQRHDSIAIQQAIRRVFHKLESKVTELGGTVKEFRGDAIFAFWEEGLFDNQAIEACRAALSLNQLTRDLATDRAVWHIPDAPLQMEWALATGPVTIDSIGGDRPTGLSLIGAPVVLAFRIEKYANSETGPIVVCAATRDKASGAFEFKDLGDKHCKGFDDASRIYALTGPR